MPCSTRPAADLQRDVSHKPDEVIAFIGVMPGMSVLELHAGDGYFCECLSQAVGEQGRVVAHNHPGALAGTLADAIEQRYGNGRLPNVRQLIARHEDLDLPRAAFDAVLLSMVYHDTYWLDADVDWGPVDHQDLLARLFEAMKPGGVVAVIDHCAAAGADPYASAVKTHRIDPAVVWRDFRRAGFVLNDESELFRNGEDDHTLDVFHPAVRGRTDRFMIRFAAPASETVTKRRVP